MATDPAADLRFASPPWTRDQSDSHPRLSPAVIGLVVLLHLLMAWQLSRLSRLQGLPAAADPLTVTLLGSRSQLPPASPVPQLPDRAPQPNAQPRPERERPPAAIDASSAPPPRTARYFDAQGRVQLPSADAARSDYQVPMAAPIGVRRAPILPGSASAIVNIGTLRTRLTPQQIAVGIGSFLFGGSHPDSCDKVEQRLVSEIDERVRGYDLSKFERYCRGWK